MPTCFVIQPFDTGPFDKRYDEVLHPAVEAAGLKPYRVDRDPAVSIPIEEIEEGIKASALCLADITLDNPNVWFEVGYAFASRKDVVLICSAGRAAKFPFDIQHLTITTYKTESPGDFDRLRQQITERLLALIKKAEALDSAAAISPAVPIHGLEPHAIAALVSIGQTAEDSSPYAIRQDMEKAGFTEVATSLALRQLKTLGFIEQRNVNDYDGQTYVGFGATEAGLDWLERNQNLLVLKRTS